MAVKEKVPHNKKSKIKRIYQLRSRGYTLREISKTMAEEGFREVSIRTIERLSASKEAEPIKEQFRAALEELQLEDLKLVRPETILDEVDVARMELVLKFRDKIIERLSPSILSEMQEITVKLWGTGQGAKASDPE